MKVIEREALFIKSDKLKASVQKELKSAFSFKFYDEKACERCEYLPDRHSDVCETCPSYKLGIELASKTQIGNNQYLKLPIGGKPIVEKIIGSKLKEDLEYRDYHKSHKIKRIEFTGKLKKEQVNAVQAILDFKRGVIKAPARTGKTVLSCAAICEIRRKTLIVGSQIDWLQGFYETFVGSKTQKGFTDLKKKRIGFCKTLDDFKSKDIALATVQTFHSKKGQKLLEKIRDLFTVIVVDEIHTGAATKYARFLASMNAEYFIGLSATPSRKDMKYVLVKNILGDIIHEIKVDRLRPTVQLVKTKYKPTIKTSLWTNMVTNMEVNKPRLNLIAKYAIKDVRDGHMVLIPMSRVKVIHRLVKLINEKAGKKIAVPFFGGNKKLRPKYIELARKYKVKVIVGQAKLISTGVNIPRASAIYDTTLSANMENCQQRVSRILTAYKSKPNPLLRLFLDDSKVRKSTLSAEWWGCIYKEMKPIISERDLYLLKKYFSQKKEEQRFEL